MRVRVALVRRKARPLAAADLPCRALYFSSRQAFGSTVPKSARAPRSQSKANHDYRFSTAGATRSERIRRMPAKISIHAAAPQDSTTRTAAAPDPYAGESSDRAW